MNADKVKFSLGEIVYRKLLPDVPGMVTGILFRPHGVTYYTKWADSDEESNSFELELTTEKGFVHKD